MIKLLYAGFDILDVSFQGALPKDTLEELAIAKKIAVEKQERQLVSVGLVDAHLLSHGLKGGYAFMLDTGPLGELWSFKENTSISQWNISVSVHASSLASYGYHATRDRLIERLKAMGCKVAKESIRRADFAMDFLMPETFELKLDQVVAHSHAKVTPYWSDQQTPQENTDRPSAVFRGRNLESVTIGKMPNRQTIIYNKRKAAIELRKPFWFKVWGLDPKDQSKNIWRVELRAGKTELRDKWRLSTFQAFEESIGDVFTNASEKVRYLDDFQTDGNVSRQRQHPLWDSVKETLESNLCDFRSGLLPNQMIEVIREQKIETYIQQIQGNAAGLSIALGLSEEDIRENYGKQIAQTLSNSINHPDTTFWDSRQRAKQRLVFL